MKRPIEFRVWHNTAKKMLESGSNKQVFSWFDEGQDISIMQYTGMKDINGTKIYEGDIVESDHIPNGKIERLRRIIVFHNGAFRTQRSKSSSATSFNNLFPQKIYKTNLTVIGNVHQNPKLLNQ